VCRGGIIDLPSGESIFATGVARSLGEPRGGAPIGLANFPVAYCGLKNITLLRSVSLIFSGSRPAINYPNA